MKKVGNNLSCKFSTNMIVSLTRYAGVRNKYDREDKNCIDIATLITDSILFVAI